MTSGALLLLWNVTELQSFMAFQNGKVFLPLEPFILPKNC